jgi:prepilin-type N-terminal cleavage/methylation domain-containing protein
MNRAVKIRGFTLIELMLAMGFISVLLLAIATTVIQISAVYSKGMTFKEVNQSARDISNDLRRSIASSSEVNPATDYIEITEAGTRIGGRLCLGTVSYIWNYGSAVQTNHSALTKHQNGDLIRLGKVVDAEKLYCAREDGELVRTSVPSSERSLYNAVLQPGDRTLEIYQFRIITDSRAFDASTEQRLYTLQFRLGSGEYTTMNSDQSKCKEPHEDGSDLQYCMVEQFNLVVRAGNKVILE